VNHIGRALTDESTDIARPSLMLARGLLRHCPRCGAGHLFRRWFTLVEGCPRCHYRFEREEGHWLGAYVVNFGITEGTLAVFMVWFIFRLASSDTGGGSVVPWIAGALVLGLVVPVLFYPYSKTIWTAIDLIMHKGRPGPDEQ
jgi:uncharacterized protein (DUF983 family)